MSILSSNHPVENQVANSISRFLSDFQVIHIFRTCGCVKAKGISVEFLFAYILGNVAYTPFDGHYKRMVK